MKHFRFLIVGTFACVVAMSLFALDAQAQGRRPGPPQRPGREMAPPPHREVAPPPPRREYQLVWERMPDGRWIQRRVEVRPEPRPVPPPHHPAPRPEYRPAPPPHHPHHPEPYYPEPTIGQAVGTLIEAAIRGDL